MPTKEVEYENDIYSIHAKLAFDMADLVIGDYNVVLSSSRKKHADVDEYGSSLLSVILYYLMLYRSNWKEIDTSIGINIEELFDYIDSMQYALDYLVVEIPKATAEYIVKSMTKTLIKEITEEMEKFDWLTKIIGAGTIYLHSNNALATINIKNKFCIVDFDLKDGIVKAVSDSILKAIERELQDIVDKETIEKVIYNIKYIIKNIDDEIVFTKWKLPNAILVSDTLSKKEAIRFLLEKEIPEAIIIIPSTTMIEGVNIPISTLSREKMFTLDDFPESISKVVSSYIIKPFREHRKYALRNIVLVGPPGIGKTTLAKAILYEIGYSRYILLSSSMYRNMWYGESERKLHNLLSMCEKHGLPLIIDNAEFIGSRNIEYRTSSSFGLAGEVTEFLNYLEQNTHPTIIIFNNIGAVDNALLRHGRVDAILVVGYPDSEWKKKIMENIIRKYDIELSNDEKEMVTSTIINAEYVTPAEIEGALRLYAINRNIEIIKTILAFSDKEKRKKEFMELLNKLNKINNIKIVLPYGDIYV